MAAGSGSALCFLPRFPASSPLSPSSWLPWDRSAENCEHTSHAAGRFLGHPHQPGPRQGARQQSTEEPGAGREATASSVSWGGGGRRSQPHRHARAALTDRRALRGVENREAFSPGSGGRESEAKVLAGLCSLQLGWRILSASSSFWKLLLACWQP